MYIPKKKTNIHAYLGNIYTYGVTIIKVCAFRIQLKRMCKTKRNPFCIDCEETIYGKKENTVYILVTRDKIGSAG